MTQPRREVQRRSGAITEPRRAVQLWSGRRLLWLFGALAVGGLAVFAFGHLVVRALKALLESWT